MRVRSRVLVLVALVVLLSGCTADPGVTSSFRDADLVFDGPGDATTHDFTVPPGNRTLRVAIHYVLEPDGHLAAQVYPEGYAGRFGSLDIDGPAETKDAAWTVVRNAPAGPWSVVGDLEGGGRYRFGIYIDGAATPSAR